MNQISFKICYLLFLVFFANCGAFIDFYEVTAEGLDEWNRKQNYLTCYCGEADVVTNRDLPMRLAEIIFFHVTSFKNVSENVEADPVLRYFIQGCTRCEVAYTKCFDSNNVDSTNGYCVKRSVDFRVTEGRLLWAKDTGSAKVIVPDKGPVHKKKILTGNKVNIVKRSLDSYPIEKVIPLGRNTASTAKIDRDAYPIDIDIPLGSHLRKNRLIRQAQACSYPTTLETAAMKCRIYPSSIKCRQQCAFGHTLENGTEQYMQCRFKENKWRPTGFKECQPFVDCTLTLITGGTTTCSTPELEKGPECHVECWHYEDKPAVPKDVYKCNIDGKWDPPLPFCVMPGSGLVLAPKPKDKSN